MTGRGHRNLREAGANPAAGHGELHGRNVPTGPGDPHGTVPLPGAGPGPWADVDDFPGRAAAALDDAQLRANLRNATTAIR
ncbi:MAG: hypothetical protein GWN71_17990, partial [Gammaproteobacteria bacterium]|nr:hypothetical protein [Gemmatimonadota bacterium]NIU75395.1 hypothetical protein [Gammaproteobacteria bacterium]